MHNLFYNRETLKPHCGGEERGERLDDAPWLESQVDYIGRGLATPLHFQLHLTP